MTSIRDAAAQVPGYDPDNLRVSDAQAFLRHFVPPAPLAVEHVALLQALDRVLAQDLVSPIDVPAHDNAAMDGYAFAGAQLRAGAPLTLTPLAGTALAGTPWRTPVAPGQCLRTMTGAMLAPGTDTVVPLELTQPAPDGRITIAADALAPGAHRRPRGEDLAHGATALARGERLTPAALGLVASLGMDHVTVLRRLRVALLSTGSEILQPGAAPRPGAVYDSNRHALHGLLQRLGAQVLDLGAVPDDPALLRAAFTRGATEADVLITSGGASVGDADHTHALMRELADAAFWHLAMRPGRPLVVGKLHAEISSKSASSAQQTSDSSYQRESILFGLPGNPVAAVTTFITLVRPALLRRMGCTCCAPPPLRAASTGLLRKKPGRTEYLRGIVRQGPDGHPQVAAAGHQGSGVLSSMARANGLIVLHHDQGDVSPGDLVDVLMFDGAT